MTLSDIPDYSDALYMYRTLTIILIAKIRCKWRKDLQYELYIHIAMQRSKFIYWLDE